MKSTCSIIIILAFVISFTTSCKQEKKEEVVINTEVVESEGIADYLLSGTLWMQRSAEYRANCYQAFNYAKMSLEKNLKAAPKGKPVAIILDIDETVLDNSYYQAQLVRDNKLYETKTWKEWTDKKCAEAMPGAIDFLYYAKSLGVEILYVTNRKEHEKDATIANMKEKGFPEVAVENFKFRQEGEPGGKEPRRQEFMERYNIILFLGDNLADFEEIFEKDKRGADDGFVAVDNIKDLFGDKYIVLPNPMYGDWEDNLRSDRKAALKFCPERAN